MLRIEHFYHSDCFTMKVAMAESSQHKLDRIRPPRVQITYDVETGDTTEKKELPLVIGVLADLSGKRDKPLPKLKERGFVEIDRDNVDEIIAAIGPRVSVLLESKLIPGEYSRAELVFRSMDDFSPAKIVTRVPTLKRLFEARSRLSDLLAKLDGNDELDTLLRKAVASPDSLRQIQAEAQTGLATDPAPE
jgi:type VI secretion system protein ImpB